MEKLFELKKQRDELAEKFRKLYSYARQETQDELEKICNEIKSLSDKTFIPAKTLRYKYDETTRETSKIVEDVLIVPSKNEKFNNFFRWAIDYMEYLDKWTPVYHVRNHYPYSRRIKNSLDIYGAAYENLFVDDFVYTTTNGNLGLCIGSIKMDPWNTNFGCCLTGNVHANILGNTEYLLCEKGVIKKCFSCFSYHDERTVGKL